MLPLEIRNNIYWTGVVDFSSLDFHGYSISPIGTTYNCYLIKDKKTVLVDTVKSEYFYKMLENIKHLTDPEKIDYIIINHVELDHAGCLEEVVKVCKPEKIFCSPMGKKAMENHFNCDGWPIEVVKTGDVINIGKKNIQFIEARMLHWPDSMFSYVIEDKLLFSNDAFGQNIASTERFTDELLAHVVDHASMEYYYNIILPYSQRVITILDQIGEMKLDIETIAPDHGLIHREKKAVNHVLQEYRNYAEQKPQKRALIFFDTMWNSTPIMADKIAEGLVSVGIPTRIMNLKQHHHSFVMTELARCGLVIGGSPTHNNSVMPNIAAMLTYMKGLRPKHRIGGAFGSYGWSGEGPSFIQREFESMGFKVPMDSIKVMFVPSKDDLDDCFEMGQILGKELLEYINEFKH